MTSTKTTEWYFPILASMPNNTTTNWPTLSSIYIPETIVAFSSCYIEVTIHDLAAAATSFTTKNLSFQLGAAGYTSYPWTQTYTNSGENIVMMATIDVTANFTANWSGTSMTADLQGLFNQHANGFGNCTAKLVITYAYDETSTSQIKTVRIPLSSTYSALATSKPGAALDTIPALDTFLPETSKTIRQITIVIEGNQHLSNLATDIILSMELDSAGANTSSAYERALGTTSYFRYTWQPSFDTSTTHDFYLWADRAACNSPIVYMVIDYEYDPDSTNIMNSIILNMEISSPVGLSTTEYSSQNRYFWINEPGTITTSRCACIVKYHSNGNPGNINHRIVPSATWVQTTSNGNVNAGSFVLQANADALTLSRGRNSIGIELRSTSTTVLMTNASSFWIINYTSENGGVHKHNQTTYYKIATTEGQTASRYRISSDFSINEYGANSFRTGIGLDIIYISNTTGNPAGLSVQAQLRDGATHTGYADIYSDIATDDAETGIRYAHAQARDLFNRWSNDTDASRIPLTDARKFKLALANNCLSFTDLTLSFTTHEFAISGSGNITGGTTNAKTVRVYTAIQGLIHEETIAGVDTSYGFTWYDNVYDVFVVITDDVTGESAATTGLADTTLNVSFGATGAVEYGSSYIG